MSKIADLNLFESGLQKIEWAKNHAPLLSELEHEFSVNKQFEGVNIALSIHLEAKTAYLCCVLKAGGANMFIAGSNPLSTQDDIAAALVHMGMEVYAKHGCSDDEYFEYLNDVLDNRCNIIIDDGGDLVNILHNSRRDLLTYVWGGCEETTTGINRLRILNSSGKLEFPMFAVNDADCKHLFDNRYGTGQSVWDGINRTTNLIVAGKTVVVAGYGWCGKGVAMRAKGLGAKVVVTEVNTIRALEAHMDGFTVMKMEKAAAIADFIVTVTGCNKVVSENDFRNIKSGCVLCNAGHFDVEIDMSYLSRFNHRSVRNNIVEYDLGDRVVNVIADGRLVNLAAGDGHPVEIMDMSFAIQALCANHIASTVRYTSYQPFKRLRSVPEKIDSYVSKLKLDTLNISIDELTSEQRDYLGV